MAKRKAKLKRTTVRFNSETASAVAKLESSTGWSQTECLAFLTRAGLNALYDQGRALDPLRHVLAAAVDAAEAKRYAERHANEGKARLREARKLLQNVELPTAELPDRPKMGPVIVSGRKRGRGRPRKAAERPAEPNSCHAAGREGPRTGPDTPTSENAPESQ